MARRLVARGAVLVDRPEGANYIVVNTCGFVRDAKEESIRAVLAACRAYEDTPVLVMGCLVQRYKAELASDIPEVSGWFDLAQTGGLIDHIISGTATGATPGMPGQEGSGRLPILPGGPRGYAFIKISDGCDEPCTFCAIPTIKGGYYSVPTERIVEEADACLSEGARELVLVGQDTAIWSWRGMDLAGLARRLAEDGRVRWIRFMYLQPEHVDDHLLESVAAEPKVCAYLDLPFQHASRSVLERMGRAGDRAGYLELLARARRLMPEVSLRSSFIAGFPGETEEDFSELMEFVREAGFDHAGVFAFSPEEGTTAARLRPRVPRKTVLERVTRLSSSLASLAEERSLRWVGTHATVMVESLCGRGGEGEDGVADVAAIGRTAGQAPEVDGVTYVEGDVPQGTRHGDMIDVEIAAVAGCDLVARWHAS